VSRLTIDAQPARWAHKEPWRAFPADLGATPVFVLAEVPPFHNLVTASGHDGINVATATTTLTRNLAFRNASLGIEAVPGLPTEAETTPSQRQPGPLHQHRLLSLDPARPARTLTWDPRVQSLQSSDEPCVAP
jgi:hypothetical protein